MDCKLEDYNKIRRVCRSDDVPYTEMGTGVLGLESDLVGLGLESDTSGLGLDSRHADLDLTGTSGLGKPVAKLKIRFIVY